MALNNSSGIINPDKFALPKRRLAHFAQQADEDHSARIRGTNNRREIDRSFYESIKSWNPNKSLDRVQLGTVRSVPDGGMRELARKRQFL